MSNGSEEEKSKKIIQKGSKTFDKLSSVINDLLSGMVSMYSEIKQLSDHVQFSLLNFDEKINSVLGEVEELKKSRKKQEEIYNAQLEKVSTLEEKGFSLGMDKTLIAHILSTQQLIFDELGSLRKTIEKQSFGLNSIFDKIEHINLNVEVLKEKTTILEGTMMRVHADNQKTVSRLVKLLLVSLATIASLVGVGTLFESMRLW